tara:strand:- start:6515 stop:7855 length:1341 start_codon:yes stop_codon:yes gene_type:complete
MNLPFYKIVVNEHDDTGVDFNAFVDAPAHMKGFIAFGKDQVRYSFNDEKRIVTGVMISVGTPIYRADEQFGEHYVVFDAPTVETIRTKFFKQGFNKNLNADHDPNQVIQGATLIDSYIASNTDPKLPSIPEAFDHMKLMDGTWIASYKIQDDSLWQSVKDGKFKGFSVEGWFDKVQINVKENHNTMKLVKAEQFDKKVSQISKYHINIDEVEIKLHEQLNYIDVNGEKVPVVSGEYITEKNEKILVDSEGRIQKIGFVKTNNKMAEQEKKDSLWSTLKSFFDSEESTSETPTTETKFAQATTAEGVVVMYDGELATGTQVFIESEGEQLPAPEGSHQLTLEDGMVKIIVLDGSGVVTEIEDFTSEAEEAPSEEVIELRKEVEELMKEVGKAQDERFKKLEDKNKALETELKTIKEGGKFKATPKSGAAKDDKQKLSSSSILENSRK